MVILYLLTLVSLEAAAQIPVSKEPMHHNVFENAFVRLLDVHVSPGDTSLFHKHETPSVFIVLSPARTGSEVLIEEEKATALSRDASISFEGFYKTPRVHRVWNSDTTVFHVMDIEMVNKSPNEKVKPLMQEGFSLLLDEKSVRTYRYTWQPGPATTLTAPAPLLIIGLTDATESITVNDKAFVKKGDFTYVGPGTAVTFTGKAKQQYSFAVLEIK